MKVFQNKPVTENTKRQGRAEDVLILLCWEVKTHNFPACVSSFDVLTSGNDDVTQIHFEAHLGTRSYYDTVHL